MKTSKLFSFVLLSSFLFSVLALSSCKDDVPQNEKFIGQYNVAESCPSGNYTYSINIVASSSSDEGIIINNFGESGAPVNATVSNSSVTIPSQTITIQGTSISVDGSGTISGSILLINYTYSAAGQGETCSMNCTKQ